MTQSSTSHGADRTPLPLVQLSAIRRDADPASWATASLQLAIGDRPVQLEIELPAGEAPPSDLLPIYQGLTNLVVDVAVQSVERQGKSVSCCKGCGACCRQPVPISETEARAIARLVDEMPEPRRSVVRKRFDEVRRRLSEAGLLERYLHPERLTSVELMALGADYFALGIACPFLEDESCSIHPERPLACREYLVTSPAENCARPATATIDPVPLPIRVASAVRAGDRHSLGDGTGWVLLSLATDWTASQPQEESRPGPELLGDFLDRLFTRTDWVHEDNLRPFLTAVGWALGAEFGPGDWLAVEKGLGDTDESADRWFEFVYVAQRAGRIQLAHGDNGAVRFRGEIPAELDPQIRLAAEMCRQFRMHAGSAGMRTSSCGISAGN